MGRQNVYMYQYVFSIYRFVCGILKYACGFFLHVPYLYFTYMTFYIYRSPNFSGCFPFKTRNNCVDTSICTFFVWLYIYIYMCAYCISWAIGIRTLYPSLGIYCPSFFFKSFIGLLPCKVHSSNTNIATLRMKTCFLIEISAVCHLTFVNGIVAIYPKSKSFH